MAQFLAGWLLPYKCKRPAGLQHALLDFGERLVFEIFRSFTGFPLDQLDDVKGVNFWLSEDEERSYSMKRAAKSASVKERFRVGRVGGVAASRPWWKFWA